MSRLLTIALSGNRTDQNSDQTYWSTRMKTMPLSEVKTKLSELVNAVERRDEVVSITRNGKPVAMIVSKEEYESWRETMDIMRDTNFMREIRKGIKSLKRAEKRYSSMSCLPNKFSACWSLTLKAPAEVHNVIRHRLLY
jgi:antitoxin YefM